MFALVQTTQTIKKNTQTNEMTMNGAHKKKAETPRRTHTHLDTLITHTRHSPVNQTTDNAKDTNCREQQNINDIHQKKQPHRN